VATVPQDAGEGKVTGQSPAGGEYAGSGTQIILTIEDKEASEGPDQD
jgi:hypothetical protein